MIKIENIDIYGFEAAIRGMRNPMNSWNKSDSKFVDMVDYTDETVKVHDINGNKLTTYYDDLREWDGENQELGPNDLKLMEKLSNGGPVHAKFRRMITVSADITAPLYWWKEYDTYKIGTVANSCSTMHKIHDKEFTIDDFSVEYLIPMKEINWPKNMNVDNIPIVIREGKNLNYNHYFSPLGVFQLIIDMLNKCRKLYLETKDKKYWWQMIQLLPSSYNQKRTVLLNYEVLHNIYIWRKDHKLDEWRDFCKWIETLPYAKGVIF